jgi:hypothetical protein
MNIDIKLIQPNYNESVSSDNCTYEKLVHYKLVFEERPMLIDNISFNVDPESMLRLEYISLLDYELEFIDSNNTALSLSGSEINALLPTIKNNLGIRYNIVNKVYNDLKIKLDVGITDYQVISTFYESLYDTPFTQNIYDDLSYFEHEI